MARTVFCNKFRKELPGLEKPPFKGPVGERVFNEISQQAWDLWMGQKTLIVNHYGLSLGDPEARAMLRQQMEEFFFGEGAQMPEGWTPPTAVKGGFGQPTK